MVNSAEESIKHDILELVRSEFKYEELCAALLCLYFSSGLNKTQFEKVLELSSLFSDLKFPKNFKDCSQVLLNMCNDSVAYEKNWFCGFCKVFVELQRQHQRTCLSCAKKLIVLMTFKS